jgi:ABC-2 type transport system permease protein
VASSRPVQPAAQAVSRGQKAHPWGYFFWCELLKIFRNPPTVIFSLGFPTLFFLIFGTTFPTSAVNTLAANAAYGALIVSFQTFSISLANERALGWNKLLRTTSMSSVLYLGTKFLVIIITGILSILLLFAVASLSGKVQMDLAIWAQLLLMMVIGMIPLGFLGLFLGFVGTENLTTALSTSLLLLLSFASGLFIPLQIAPDVIKKIAPYLPSYHLGQLGWITVNSPSQDSQPLWAHILILFGFAAVFAALAAWAYVRDENKNFG